MANFLKNLWDKTKTAREKLWNGTLGKVTKTIVTGAASLVGAGGVAQVLFNKIDSDTKASMEAAANRDGVIKSDEVDKTVLQKSGVAPTPEQSAAILNQFQANTGLPIEGNDKIKINSDGTASAKFNLIDFLKTKWYFVAGGLVGVYLLFFNKPKGRGRRF